MYQVYNSCCTGQERGEEGTYDACGFRKTRSGSAFSPWYAPVGVALHAAKEFHIHRRIREVLAAQAEQAESETATWRDPDQDDLPVTTAPVAAPEAAAPSPPSVPETNLSLSSTETHFDASISKEKWHRRSRKKRLRRERREREQDPEMNRPMKAVAAKRAAASIGQSSQERSEAETSPTQMPSLTDSGRTPHRVLGTRDGETYGGPLVSAFSLDLKDGAKVAKTGYMGVLDEPSKDDLAADTVEELVSRGFRYYAWDGRSSHTILDATETYVIGALVGSPDDPTYLLDVNKELQDAFDEAHDTYQFDGKENRRGANVRAISCGISFGGGQQRVGMLSHGSSKNEEVVKKLVDLTATKRIAMFGNAALQMFEPKIYKYCDKVLTNLCARNPSLRRNWKKCAFACATFNVGPRTVTCKHYDHLNLAYGPCAITAIGTYNPKTSGHLVLWDLGLIIEFPPLACIIIPSAIVAHSNTRIGPHERRYSFTQYSAAGLFRWEDCGYMSKKTMEKSGRRLGSGKEYWDRAVHDRISTWKEVQEMWARMSKSS